MMQIFSYIFYTFSKMYRAGLDRKDPDVYACGLVSLLQAINIITIVKPYLDSEYEKYIWVGIFIIIAILGMFFFNAKTLQIFDERWDGEPRRKRLVKRVLILIYVILTFYLPVALYMKPID